MIGYFTQLTCAVDKTLNQEVLKCLHFFSHNKILQGRTFEATVLLNYLLSVKIHDIRDKKEYSDISMRI